MTPNPPDTMTEPKATELPDNGEARITGWDDFFVHQTPYPIVQTISMTPNWIDRFYWNVQDTSGSLMFGVGLGGYRTTSRMDSIVYLLHGKQQRILRLARRTNERDYADPQIGPLSFSVVEPLRKWRLSLGENPSGIAWDLVFEASGESVDYRQFEFDNENGQGSNYHHFVQLGRCTGVVSVDGHTINAGTLLTSRDRSWGVRRAREGQGLLLWLHHQFDEVDLCMILIEARDGTLTYFDGTATTDGVQVKLVSAGHDLRLDPATRDVLGGSVEMLDANGRHYKVEYRERLLRGYLGGIGYGGWQGRDRGDLFMETETIDMSRPASEILAAQPMHLFGHLMRASLNGGPDTVGDLEGGLTRSRSYLYQPRRLQPA